MEKSTADLYVPRGMADHGPFHTHQPWAARKKRRSWTWLYGILALFLVISMLLWTFGSKESRALSKMKTAHANATLGFGAIYAVSRTNSPRRMQLERAAELTGLDIRFPIQPKWTEEHIGQIKAEENSTMTRGSALAWLGHLNALERFLDSPYETALIVEDDVDFDTHLRTEQIPAAANAIRELLGESDQTAHYYGDSTGWDIIWLGHCGDTFDKQKASTLSSIQVYTDRTLPFNEYLLESTLRFLQGLGIMQDQQRIVHQSVNPLCTFGYAVSRDAATRLVTEYAAREPSREPRRPCEAYDVRLLEACRDDGFRCITVTPELFHHTLAPSEISAASADATLSGDGDDECEDTPNIWCSARSHLWWINNKMRYNKRKLTARGEALSKLAQTPGECYLDQLR